MKRAIIILIILSAFRCEAQVNIGIPGIEQVVKTFFSHYQLNPEAESYITFEKKQAGWYVGTVNYTTGTQVEPSHLFWNKATASYENLPYNERNDPDSTVIKNEVNSYMNGHLDEATLYNYQRNLFYGYDNWDWDVIVNLQNKSNLTDTLLETLARAYSSYAINYFYPQYGLSSTNNDSDRIKLKDSEPISISRAKKFVHYENLAIATYQQLKALNPLYETKVGNIATKMAGEHMFAWSTLKFNGFENDATRYLTGVSYPDSILQKAKNMLQEIKPNSIFFTWGDNVTYPVWYLQSQGIRNDVIALDYTLISLRRVLKYLDKKYNYSLFAIDSAVYLSPMFDYALYQSEYASDKEITLDSFLNRLYGSNTLQSITAKNKTTYYTDDSSFKYFHKKVYMPVNTSKAQKLYGMKRFYGKIYLPMEKHYLFMNEMIAFAISSRNFLKKHIYFSFETETKNKMNGIVKRSLVWELTPVIE